MNTVDDRFFIDKSLADLLDFNPYYPLVHSGIAGEILIGREKYFDLASNDYLGLASRPELKEALIAGVKKYGASGCGTPIATGYSTLFYETEQKLSEFLQLQDSVLFPSCYQANVGLFPALARPGDLIIFDHYVHASLVQGIRSAGCRVKPFRHNDPEHLEKVLLRSDGFDRIFVVTESVFSTEGTVAPFEKIVKICRDFDALPVIDDSHGIGVMGHRGRGILEYCQIDEYDGLYTASLGKALANCGGVVAGPKQIIDYLRYSCGGLIYSTAVPPSILCGIGKVLDIISRDFSRLMKKMWSAKAQIEAACIKVGLDVSRGKAPIISIRCESPLETLRLTQKFYENHILTTPFIPPSVPPGSGVVRLIAGAKLKKSQIETILDVIGKLK
ncbi:MAG: pyridoxal phosphate-dependent aminotransferase family protein [Candidatus Marinimicrobia bacterium]|nr:pyridoxal phosphate-dependent aminotransferase family protein [Candidatus Neomarinimicrobiota bacterium]